MGASILKMGYLLSSYQLSDFIICKEGNGNWKFGICSLFFFLTIQIYVHPHHSELLSNTMVILFLRHNLGIWLSFCISIFEWDTLF